MSDERGAAEAAARVVALQARLDALRAECDQQAQARLAAQAEVERLQELVVALEVRLAAHETPAVRNGRGLAALITPRTAREA